MTPPWGSYNDCHAYHYWWGPSFPSGGPLIDLLTKDESVPSGGGGWPGRRWGEEPCVLLRVGIRPSRAFFTLIGTTPEPHTKSITSGAMGTQCGRARRNQWEQAGGSGSFERVGPLTLQSREIREQRGRKKKDQEREKGDKGKILCFCLRERACCKSSKASSFSARVSFSCFSSLSLSVS